MTPKYSNPARLHWYPDLSCPVCGVLRRYKKLLPERLGNSDWENGFLFKNAPAIANKYTGKSAFIQDFDFNILYAAEIYSQSSAHLA